MDQNVTDVAQTCVEQIKEDSAIIEDPCFLLEVEFLSCELMVRHLRDRQVRFMCR